MSRKALLGAAFLVLSGGQANAFKMGDQAQYVVTKRAGQDLLGRWTYDRIDSDSVRFGDPVHEDMTKASIEMAQKDGGALQCKPDAIAFQAFVGRPTTVTVRSHMCCSPSAKSFWCDQLGDKRYSRLNQSAPLVDGVRWNDDPCHMTLSEERTTSRVGWATWMIDPRYMRSNNLNYASHFHEKQFLHAMASGSRGRSASYLESRSETKAKVLAWAEFAYRVADGSLPVTMSMREVAGKLERESQRLFALGFGRSEALTIGFLFTGEVAPDALQVRQIAMGALLHTVQDSFSSSHVERELNRTDGEGKPLVASKGSIKRFLTYRGQSPSEHGQADRRPSDWNNAKAGDLHPVAIGADLVACAALAKPGYSTWASARNVVERAFQVVKDGRNPSASSGDFTTRRE